MKSKYKPILLALLVTVMLFQSTAVSAYVVVESGGCTMLSEYEVVSPHNVVYCDELLELFHEKRIISNAITTQENKIMAYTEALEGIEKTRNLALAGVLADYATIAVATTGSVTTLGALAAIDAYAVASYFDNISTLYSSESDVVYYKNKILSASAILESKIDDYNDIREEILDHIDENPTHYRHGVQLPATPTVNWPIVYKNY